MSKLGILYVVGTPIGNLGDITVRAKEILKNAPFVACEDTRVTKKLLDLVGSSAQSLSLHAHSTDQSYWNILKKLLEGFDVCYLTDAGTPGISDPGNELVSFVFKNAPDVIITPIPGVSSLTTIASVSGINLRQFTFAGFAPKKKSQKFFKKLIENDLPFIYLDSPHRVIKNLKLIVSSGGGELDCVVGRELTKLHESIYRGRTSEVLSKLIELSTVKGEVIILVSSTSNSKSEPI